MDWLSQLKETKAELDAVSPSFCLAKWLQVTLHLQNGFNHSCHHPRLHQTPLKELERGPAALHNTTYKMGLRQMMLNGKRPSECSFCWKIEDAPGSHFSDRIVKSNDDWARSRLKEMASWPAKKPVTPAYLEVSFGSLCNFRCSYCLPFISSSIWKQYEKHGPYIDRSSVEEVARMGMAPIPEGVQNPYLEAFWRWLPEISGDLKVLRITGGEPLLSPSLPRLLDYLETTPHPDLELGVNSNLGVPDGYFQNFLARLESLTKKSRVKSFMLYTSADTAGAQAEYLRTGMRYEKWRQNLRTYMERSPWPAMVMVAFNALSPPRFEQLLADLSALNLEAGAGREGAAKRIVADCTHLMHPEYLSPWILDQRWRQKITEIFAFMQSRRDGAEGFNDYELNKMGRIVSWLESAPLDPERLADQRGKFYLFSRQYEQREKVRFLKVFPEMREFYELCGRAAERRATPPLKA